MTAHMVDPGQLNTFPLRRDGPPPPPPPPPPESSGSGGEDEGHKFMKGPKRKRLAKACDACHKSKRRCDGTAPCSNCYFASKKCSYTDATGRPVPAPRPNTHPTTVTTPTASSASPSFQGFEPSPSPDGGKRKRLRETTGASFPPVGSTSAGVFGSGMGSGTLRLGGPSVHDGALDDADISALDPSLLHELVNLFFTHCHPYRLIFHRPSFKYSPTLTPGTPHAPGHVPAYLVLAICANSAHLSRRPSVRTTPRRAAGNAFGRRAIRMLVDEQGFLKPGLVPEEAGGDGGAGRNGVCLEVVQALCMLQQWDIMACGGWSMRYHELALQILARLDVASPANGTRAECTRRCFWLIYLVDIMMSAWLTRSVMFRTAELARVRLPVDETRFEFGESSGEWEYLFQPALRTAHASEFGHLLRVFTINVKVESTVDMYMASESPTALQTLMQAETDLEAWAATLPDHLRFAEDSMEVQMSMFETSSNTSAWCFCMMQVVHASTALALNVAKQRSQRELPSGPQWALDRLEKITHSLGDRAKFSPLLGAVLWPLLKYCKRNNDAKVQAWSRVNEEVWGMKIEDFVPVAWRLPNPGPAANPHLDPALGSGASTGAEQQQLPSLKASGLLDSWGRGGGTVSGSGIGMGKTPSPPWQHIQHMGQFQEQTAGSAAHGQTQAQPSSGTATGGGAGGSGSTGMPVGLQWLAHEAAGMRPP